MSRVSYIPRLDRKMVRNIVMGCIRETIRAHGPITDEWSDSAAKRITNAMLGEIAVHIEREKLARAARG